jgi:hypothetical protein
LPCSVEKNNQPAENVTQFAAKNTLRYFTHMPNWGVMGGSREVAPYLRFCLDFYDNLPEV